MASTAPSTPPAFTPEPTDNSAAQQAVAAATGQSAPAAIKPAAATAPVAPQMPSTTQSTPTAKPAAATPAPAAPAAAPATAPVTQTPAPQKPLAAPAPAPKPATATPAPAPVPATTPIPPLPTTAPNYGTTPGTAPVSDAGSDTVQGQLNDLLSSGSPLLKQAEGNAIIAMNARGLQNSSLATQSADQAVISEALPIAEQDASFVQQSVLLAQQLANATQLTQEQQDNWLQQNVATLHDTLTTMATTQGYNLQLSYIQQAGTLQSGLLNAIANIGSTQGLSSAQQAAAVQQLEAQYQADLGGLSSFYSNSPEWDTAWGGNAPGSSSSGDAVAGFDLVGSPQPGPPRSTKSKLEDPANFGPSFGMSNKDMTDPIGSKISSGLGINDPINLGGIL